MATYGIHGAVNQYADLPAPAKLDLGTVFLVRQDAGAPEGAGLYWIRKGVSGRAWAFLDGLSLQRADEVPYASEMSGLPAVNVQQAIDLLAGSNPVLNTFEIHVDPVRGVDAPERGGALCPFRTVAYAYGRVPDLADDEAALTQWCAEQIVFRLAPGEYDEGDIPLGLKRAHLVLRGQGVVIPGSIVWQAELADIPTLKAAAVDDGLTIKNAPGVPWPLTGFPSPSLMLIGETPGFDGGSQCRSFMVGGAVRLVLGDSLDTSGGWMDRTGPFYPGFRNLYVADGFSVEGLARSAIASAYIDNCWFVNGYVGINCDPAGQSNSQLILRARHSLFGAWGGNCLIGSDVAITEMRSCWVNGLDKALHNPTGFIYTREDGIRDCRFTGNTFNFGGAAAPADVHVDATSFASLQARKAAGATWDDAQARYRLLDSAQGVGYDGATDQTDIWADTAPQNLQDAVRRIAVALQAQIGAPIA
jgi:hypothetical protein